MPANSPPKTTNSNILKGKEEECIKIIREKSGIEGSTLSNTIGNTKFVGVNVIPPGNKSDDQVWNTPANEFVKQSAMADKV